MIQGWLILLCSCGSLSGNFLFQTGLLKQVPRIKNSRYHVHSTNEFCVQASHNQQHDFAMSKSLPPCLILSKQASDANSIHAKPLSQWERENGAISQATVTLAGSPATEDSLCGSARSSTTYLCLKSCSSMQS